MMPFEKYKGRMGGDEPEQPHTPVEANDTLQSRAYARMLHLVSEGPIRGFANGHRSIFFNDTPLYGSDGALNFQGVGVVANLGYPHGLQSYFPGFPGVETEIGVEVEVTLVAPVVRTVTQLDSDAVRVRVAIPGLQTTDRERGDINGYSLPLAIDYKPFGGGWINVITETISGKASARYEKEYRLQLSGAGPWDVRVRRLDAESESQFTSNRLVFSAYTALVDEKLTYPNRAVIGVTFDASQFRQTPTQSFELYGMLVQVPSNYDPLTRAYSGIWSGTFITAWTNNPAWCFYDMVTNNRYGLGDLVTPDAVDKAALYALGQYCDGLVPDGRGGFEPRYTLNCYLQTQGDAWQVLANIASACNAMIYGGDSGGITLVADRPQEPEMQYTEANVVNQDGAFFEYSGSARDARHNTAIVGWNDPDDGHRQALESYRDDLSVVNEGYREMQFAPLGITSQGQAKRAAKWAIVTEQKQTDTVTFKVGLDSAYLRPGAVFRIQDPKRTAVRLGGRLQGLQTLSAVTLDKPILIEVGKTYQAAIMQADGSLSAMVNVTNGAGNVATLTLATPLAQMPLAGRIWLVQVSDLQPTQWRCVSMMMESDATFNVVGVQHNPQKYAEIESGIVLPAAPTNRPAFPASPRGFVLEESLVLGTGGPLAQVVVSWQSVARAWRYFWRYRRDASAWSAWAETAATSFELQGVLAGLYDVQVYAQNVLGASPIANFSQQVLGLGARPSDVQGFLVDASTLSWQMVGDLDVRYGGGYELRSFAGTFGSWDSAVPMFTGLLTSSPVTMPVTTPGVMTVMIKAVDSSGNYSVDPALVVLGLGDIAITNIVESTDYKALGFPGVLTDCAVTALDLLADDASELFWADDALPFWRGDTDLFWTGTYKAMEYQFSYAVNTRDAGARLALNSAIKGDGVMLVYRKDTQGIFWGADGNNFWASDTNLFWPGPSAWQVWPGTISVEPGQYDFKLSISNGPNRGEVSALTLILDVDDESESLGDVSIDAGGARLVLTKNYRSIKAVQLTLQAGAGTARTVEVLDKLVAGASGPLVQCFDTNHIGVSAVIDAFVQGVKG
jgi:hypothetical protein